MRAKILATIVFAGLCTFFFAGLARAEAVVGQSAPALTTSTLIGSNFDLSALKGKVVIVYFWATWCGPCHEEMPALEAVYRQYHGKGLEVLAVSGDRSRMRGDVDQVMHFYTFPAAMLSALTKNEFGMPTILPITYVIGKNGNVENILTPDALPLTEAGLGDEVKALIDTKIEAKADAKAETKSDAKTDTKTETETKSDAKP
jgi:thiol-disulfide isomerase/thioredoxin